LDRATGSEDGMKFPRNARIFRGQLDAAPFAAVFFLLVIFVMLGTLAYTPGVRVRLPAANDFPGTDGPTADVTIARGGQLYFENQVIDARELRTRLAVLAKQSATPLTLRVRMDEEAPMKMLVNLTSLARDAGIKEMMLPTRSAAVPGSGP